jgi:hypothetical protein
MFDYDYDTDIECTIYYGDGWYFPGQVGLGQVRSEVRCNKILVQQISPTEVIINELID